jgi:hypothetical protein
LKMICTYEIKMIDGSKWFYLLHPNKKANSVVISNLICMN